MTKKEKTGSFFDSPVIVGLKRRALAQKAYLAGEIEEQRKARITSGISPWQIIRYQRVIDPEKTPVPLAPASYITPKTFEMHLQYLKKECQVLPLGELRKLIDNYQQIPERAVVITFDGGHMDNFLYAFPLLLKYDLPATICMPTYYIGNKMFFYEDRLALMLQIMSAAKVKIPQFKFLGDEFYQEIKKVEPKLAITDQSAMLFIGGLRARSEEDRQEVAHLFAEAMQNGPEPPDYEDFLRWEDVRTMSSAGITVAMMGHYHLIAPKVDPLKFVEDIGLGVREMKEQGVVTEPIFVFPMGVYSSECLDLLQTLEARYCLVIGDLPEPRFQTALPMLLGRVAMYESIAPTVDLFACRLWRLEIAGVRY